MFTYDGDVNYKMTEELMTIKIKPLLIQLFRRALSVFIEQVKRVTIK